MDTGSQRTAQLLKHILKQNNNLTLHSKDETDQGWVSQKHCEPKYFVETISTSTLWSSLRTAAKFKINY